MHKLSIESVFNMVETLNSQVSQETKLFGQTLHVGVH